MARYVGVYPGRVVLYFEDPADGREGFAFLIWAFVMDVSAKASTINSVLVVKDLSDVFLVDGYVVRQGC